MLFRSQLIGEFTKYSLNEIIITSTKYSVKTIQIKDYQLVNELSGNGYSVILEIGISLLSEEFLQKYNGKVTYFLLTGTTDPVVLQKAGEFAAKYPIVLGENFSKEFPDKIDRFPFKGIALKGGVEIKPGYGSFNELADILEGAKLFAGTIPKFCEGMLICVTVETLP